MAAHQRRVIRILAGAAYNADTPELFYKLDILHQDQLIIYHISCIMYDYNYGNLPESFIGILQHCNNDKKFRFWEESWSVYVDSCSYNELDI